MRPTFIGFETARSALNLNQKALDIVGHNIANINTAGYTRQRVNSAAVATDTYAARVAQSRTDTAGAGVELTGIGQTRDAFLDKRFRDEYSSSSYYIQTSDMLSDIESSLGDANDISEGGNMVATSLQEIFSSLDTSANEPTSPEHANLVLSSFTNFTQILQKINSDLDSVAGQQKYNMDSAIEDVNTSLQKIADLNKEISSDAANALKEGSKDTPNDLLDQRNLQIDNLASYGNIDLTHEADGSVTVEMGGHIAVNGSNFDKLRSKEDNQTGIVSLLWNSGSGEKDVPQTESSQKEPLLANFSTGALRAYTDVLNGRGKNAGQVNGSTPLQGVPYYKERLNAMARTFASTVNQIIPVIEDPKNLGHALKAEDFSKYTPDEQAKFKQLHDKNGNLVYKQLISAKIYEDPQHSGQALSANDYNHLSAEEKSNLKQKSDEHGNYETDSSAIVTADNITIDKAWAVGKANYFFSNPGSKTNASYAKELQQAIAKDNNNFTSFGETFTGSFEDYLMDYTSKVGTDTAYYDNLKDVSSALSNNLMDKRDATSGVQMDEETTNMMTYQKSYNAAARLMTVLDQMLDKLINGTGTVGL